MSEVPVQLIVAAFQDENGAEEALKELQAAKKARYIKIDNAAVIRRDADNKLHIKDVKDMGGGKGAAIGGVIGGVIGIIFPPSVLVSAGLGALVGGLAAKFSDGGFPNARLQQIGEALKPGTSAIVAVIEHTWVVEAEAELAAQGAEVFMESLTSDIAKQLEAGKDVSFTAVSAGEAVAMERAVAGQDEAQVTDVVATSEGLVARDINVTKEGATVAGLIATEEGVVGAVAEIPAKAEAAAAEAQEAEAPAAEAAAPEAPAAEEKPASQEPPAA